MTSIATRLNAIHNKINQHANPPTLIAVSKTKPIEAIQEAWEAGQRHFGENKVQEAQQKFISLKETNLDITLHCIGSLQTNKTDDAVALFDVIHTVDRLKLAKALKKSMEKQPKQPDLLIQINVGEEPQKAGVAPGEAESFIHTCREMGLPIKGLMCIPPVNQDPTPHFHWLANLAKKVNLPELSMGMSRDFETAINCGATYIRVGTAIFGER